MNRKEAKALIKSKRWKLLAQGKRPDGSTITVGEVLSHTRRLSQACAKAESRYVSGL
jgi:hypothetical protein